MNWKRFAVGLGSAAIAALAVALPASLVVTLPIVGSVSVTALLASIGSYLGGWATLTPGQPPTPTPPKT